MTGGFGDPDKHHKYHVSLADGSLYTHKKKAKKKKNIADITKQQQQQQKKSASKYQKSSET